MKYYNEFCHFLSERLELDQTILRPMIGTILIIAIFESIKIIADWMVNSLVRKENRYKVFHSIKLVVNIIEIMLLVVFLTRYIANLTTFVSLLTSSLTLVFKDVFVNAFYGAYVKKHKIFKLEDRVEVNGVKGDIINIGRLSFDMLEVQDLANGQSTGVIITVPNSYISNKHIKNYNKGFEHIWSELTVKVPFDEDIDKVKKELYKILDSMEEITKVPIDIERELAEVGTEYRIYYNNCKPIIYVNVTSKCVELKIRYLMDSKKIRFIEDELWIRILDSNKKGKIKLYKE